MTNYRIVKRPATFEQVVLRMIAKEKNKDGTLTARGAALAQALFERVLSPDAYAEIFEN